MTKTKAGPIAAGNRSKVAGFADRLVKLADDYRDDVAAVVEDINKAGLDTAAVRRLAAWSRQDPVKRAEREAIDHQYRFLAGDTETPASLPDEGELAEAARYYADKLSVRQVAKVLKISVGKAQKLKTLAEMFTVHVHSSVNAPPHDADGVIPAPAEGERAAETTAAGPDLANSNPGCDSRAAGGAEGHPVVADQYAAANGAPEPNAGLVGEADAPTPIAESCGGAVTTRAEVPLASIPRLDEASAPLKSRAPQDPSKEVAHEVVATAEPEVARAVPPATVLREAVIPAFLDRRTKQPPHDDSSFADYREAPSPTASNGGA